jgi:hypothetical protein
LFEQDLQDGQDMSQFAAADMQTHPVHPDPIPLQLRLQKRTMNTERKSTGWSQVRAQLKDWAKPALTALIKDLYDASAANRDFLHARFQAEEAGGAALEAYRRKIIEQFFPRRGFGKLKLAEARKAIRDYRKATGNVAGTVELMLTFVENGTEFTLEFGDIDEPFYNNLASVLSEMVKLLCQEGAELYPRFRERIVRLETDADHIGWGYGDDLREHVHFLEDELTDE